MTDDCRGCCLVGLVVPLLCCVAVVGAIIYIYASAPEPPISEEFRASETEAQAFENSLSSASSVAQNQGWFYITFTERQFSSWMTLRGQDFAEQQDRAFPFEDIQVGLDGGQMTFFANFSSSGLKLPLEVVMIPGVDSQNHLALEIDSAHLGGLSVPKAILDTITAQIEAKITEPLENLSGNYMLYSESLAVEDGVFAVQGQLVY